MSRIYGKTGTEHVANGMPNALVVIADPTKTNEAVRVPYLLQLKLSNLPYFSKN